MWIVWGTVSAESDLGVVAELCPGCKNVAPCRVTAVDEGVHVYLIPLVPPSSRAVAACGACGTEFACEIWRYPAMIPAAQAGSFPLKVLLERTNPDLKERLDWASRLEKFADDPRFESALRSLGELRPGDIRKRLRADLQRWGRLDEDRREDLARRLDESARTIRFMQSIAHRAPGSVGCLIALPVILATWTAGFLAPNFGVRGLWRNVGIAVAGFLAGVAAYQSVQARQVRRWTHDVLFPEGQKLGIDFHHLVAILDDLPPQGPRSVDVLCRLQEQVRTIREELSASEKKKSKGADPEVF